MKKTVVVLLIMLLAISVVFISTGCKATAAETTAAETTAEKPYEGTEIGVLSASNLQDQGYFDLFTEKTGIKVNYIEYPSDFMQIKQMVTTYLTQGGAEGIDVMALAAYTFKSLADQGLFVPLDDLFTAEQIADWPTDVVNRECRTADGQLYEAPFQVSTMAFMINQQLFDEAGVKVPTTWQELRDAAIKLTKPDGSQYGIAISGKIEGHLLNQMLLFVNQAGGNLGDMTDPKTIEGLKFLYDLVVNDKVCDPQMIMQGHCEGTGAEFVSKKTAMVLDWFGCITGVYLPMEGFDSTNMIFVPGFMGPVTDGFPSGSWTYAIPTFSKNQGAAGEFIKYCMSLDGQIANKLSLPSTGEAYADISLLSNPEGAKAQALYMSHATSRLFAGNYTAELEGVLDIDFNAALAGQISFEDALAAMQQKIDAVVKK